MAERTQSGSNAVEQLRAIAGLCNSGEFDASTSNLPLHERKINGDATDQAVLRFSESLGPVTEFRGSWKKTFELAFNSKNKFMIRTFSLFQNEGLHTALSASEASAFKSTDTLLTIKGAPDVLIGRCTKYITPDGQTRELDRTTGLEIEKIKNDWSAAGKRVILLARKQLVPQEIQSDPTSSHFESEVMRHASRGLTLVGLVGIVDPPRDEIPSVVSTLRRAGIRIFMVSVSSHVGSSFLTESQVTGDFALTAQAIAVECRIITNSPDKVHDVSHLSPRFDTSSPITEKSPKASTTSQYTSIVLSGPELITLNESQWSALCTYDEIVFARYV